MIIQRKIENSIEKIAINQNRFLGSQRNFGEQNHFYENNHNHENELQLTFVLRLVRPLSSGPRPFSSQPLLKDQPHLKFYFEFFSLLIDRDHDRRFKGFSLFSSFIHETFN